MTGRHDQTAAGRLLEGWGFAADDLAAAWRSEPLRTTGSAGRFEEVFGTEALWHLVDHGGLRAEFLSLVLDGRPVPASTYSRTVEIAGRDHGDILDADAVRRHVGFGGTVVMGSLHHYHPAVAQAASALQEYFRTEVQAHAFLTAAGRSGLRPHVDGEDNLLLQLSGTKQWQLWDTSAVQVDAWYPPANDLGEPDMVQTLSRGDSLYIPLGWAHAGQATEAASLHLTYQVLPPDVGEILNGLVDRVTGAWHPTAPPSGAIALSDQARARFEEDVRLALLNLVEKPDTP